MSIFLTTSRTYLIADNFTAMSTHIINKFRVAQSKHKGKEKRLTESAQPTLSAVGHQTICVF